jgi:hypothetical protein
MMDFAKAEDEKRFTDPILVKSFVIISLWVEDHRRGSGTCLVGRKHHFGILWSCDILSSRGIENRIEV